MKVEPSVVHIGLSQGIEAIRAEFERFMGERAEGARECMRYVLFERAGSSEKIFPNSPHKRDHTRNGETLDDFVNHLLTLIAHRITCHMVSCHTYHLVTHYLSPR